MKLNKTMGRVATTLVATAMLASVAVVPAFAETAAPAQGVVNGNNLTSIKINKLLYMPSDVVTPTQEFQFKIVNASVPGDSTIKIDDTDSRNLYSGVGADADMTTGSVDGRVTVSATTDNGHRTAAAGQTDVDVYTDQVELTLPDKESFTKAGVYKYDIQEVDPNDDDFTEVTSAGLDLYLIVERENPTTQVSADDSYKITGAFIYADGKNFENGTDSAKTADYVNNYKMGEDGSTVGTLEFEKTITGAMGNMGDTFDFSVTSDSGLLTNGDTYKYKKNGVEQNPIAVADGKLTFNGVGNDDIITIMGLDAGSYTVEEADNTMGYKVSYKVDNAETATDGDSANMTVVAKEIASAEFINTRNAVSPTGIVMNVAPYALLVVVAAAGCFVFMRKRRED